MIEEAPRHTDVPKWIALAHALWLLGALIIGFDSIPNFSPPVFIQMVATLVAATLIMVILTFAVKRTYSFLYYLLLLSAIALSVFAFLRTVQWLYGFDWSGFDTHVIPPFVQPRKELWDWLQLLAVLAVPIAVAIIGAQLQAQLQSTERQQQAEREKIENAKLERERERTEENLREDRLQKYLERMSHLVLEKGLKGTETMDVNLSHEARTLAETWTLDAIRDTDIERKRQIIRFLYRLHLIRTADRFRHSPLSLGVVASETVNDTNIVSLNGNAVPRDAPDFRGSQWQDSDLRRVDLRGFNLESSQLCNANFARANLAKTNLRHCNLCGATFTGANLGGADLRDVEIDVATDFSGAHLVGGTLMGFENFIDVKLTGADLSGQDFTKMDLRRHRLKNVMMKAVTLIETNLEGVDLSDSDLTNAILTNAILTNAILTDAILIHTHLEGADLTASSISAEQLAQAICDETTTLPTGLKWQPPPPPSEISSNFSEYGRGEEDD